MAQMPFSPCDTAAGVCTDDASINMLRRIFGPIIDVLIAGGDANTISSGANILATMFSFFNSGILVAASILLTFVAIAGVVNTANDGEALGKDWSSTYTPLRIVAGGAVLLPTTSGFSFIQIIVLMVTLWGIGFANGTYKLGLSIGIFTPTGLVDGVNNPGTYYGMREFAKNYAAAEYCAHAAQQIFADQTGSGVSPLVGAGTTPDKVVVNEGVRTSTYYLRDRKESNLAGGAPFCGSIMLQRYLAQSNPEQSQTALNALRMSVQDVKLAALNGMMRDLSAWVRTWPVRLDDPAWSNIDSDKFNTIVSKYENEIPEKLTQSISAAGGDVENGLTAQANRLAKGGWAEGVGWFQKVGMVRGQITKTIGEPVGSVASGSMTGLPDDNRTQELQSVVAGAMDAIAVKAEESTAYGSSSTPRPEEMASLLPSNFDSSVNIKDLDQSVMTKMSLFVNDGMRTVVDIAVGGANSDGTTIIGDGKSFGIDLIPGSFNPCGTAGEMGGSLSRMKCLGDYLATLKFGLFAADAAFRTALAVGNALAAVTPGVPNHVAISIWKWAEDGPLKQMAILNSYLTPMVAYFSVILPSLPYVVFMIVVAGWLLSVLQAIVAAPLWAVMHMRPDRSFIGSDKQGYMLMMGLFFRPALAIVGLFASFMIIDPLIDFIAKGFFDMRGAVVTSTGGIGFVAQFFTFAWWILAFAGLLAPIVYMTFALPQTLPDHVLRWIGAGVEDLGSTTAAGTAGKSLSSLGTEGGSAKRIASNKPGGDDPPPPPGSGGGNKSKNPQSDKAIANSQGVPPSGGDSSTTPNGSSTSLAGSNNPAGAGKPPQRPVDNRRDGQRLGDAIGMGMRVAAQSLANSARQSPDTKGYGVGYALGSALTNAGAESAAAFREGAAARIKHLSNGGAIGSPSAGFEPAQAEDAQGSSNASNEVLAGSTAPTRSEQSLGGEIETAGAPSASDVIAGNTGIADTPPAYEAPPNEVVS